MKRAEDREQQVEKDIVVVDKLIRRADEEDELALVSGSACSHLLEFPHWPILDPGYQDLERQLQDQEEAFKSKLELETAAHGAQPLESFSSDDEGPLERGFGDEVEGYNPDSSTDDDEGDDWEEEGRLMEAEALRDLMEEAKKNPNLSIVVVPTETSSSASAPIVIPPTDIKPKSRSRKRKQPEPQTAKLTAASKTKAKSQTCRLIRQKKPVV